MAAYAAPPSVQTMGRLGKGLCEGIAIHGPSVMWIHGFLPSLVYGPNYPVDGDREGHITVIDKCKTVDDIGHLLVVLFQFAERFGRMIMAPCCIFCNVVGAVVADA